MRCDAWLCVGPGMLPVKRCEVLRLQDLASGGVESRRSWTENAGRSTLCPLPVSRTFGDTLEGQGPLPQRLYSWDQARFWSIRRASVAFGTQPTDPWSHSGVLEKGKADAGVLA